MCTVRSVKIRLRCLFIRFTIIKVSFENRSLPNCFCLCLCLRLFTRLNILNDSLRKISLHLHHLLLCLQGSRCLLQHGFVERPSQLTISLDLGKLRMKSKFMKVQNVEYLSYSLSVCPLLIRADWGRNRSKYFVPSTVSCHCQRGESQRTCQHGPSWRWWGKPTFARSQDGL